MLKVGLTGGIGSGKSSASRLFAELGVPVIDADIIAREVVEPGTPALTEIETAFGSQVIGNDGRLDRVALRKMVFSKPEHREKLESILHPRIHAEIMRQINELSTPYCIVVIPLLAESKSDYQLDRILVIDLPEAMQRARAAIRDQRSEEEINHVIQAQASRTARQKMADDLVDNSGTLETLIEQIHALHKKYLALAVGAQ